MCTSPIYLNNRSSGVEHALRYVQITGNVPISLRNRILPYSANGITVPCGKCLECLRKRQNDYAVRIAEEAKLKGSFWFFTLTYSEDKLPFAYRPYLVDTSTGEVFFDYAYKSLKYRDSIPEYVQRFLLSEPRNGKPRYYYELDTDFARSLVAGSENLPDRFKVGVSVSPSLHREHVRLWIKNCRVAYKRLFGKDLSFTYAGVGEYGPRTCRPHYHFCVFGIDRFTAFWMAERWKREFGFYVLKQVKAVNKDGTPGFDIASKYVGKYISKGVFECPSVIKRDVEKPRFQASIGLGLDSEKIVVKDGKERIVRDLSDYKKNYYLCYDIFGPYDADTLRFANGVYMDADTIENICSHIKDRSHYVDSQGKIYSLPAVFKRRLFCVKDSFTKKLRVSTLRLLHSSFIASDPFSDFAKGRFESDNIFEPCSKDWFEAFEAFKHLLDYRKEVSQSLMQDSFRKFYSRSKY